MSYFNFFLRRNQDRIPLQSLFSTQLAGRWRFGDRVNTHIALYVASVKSFYPTPVVIARDLALTVYFYC